MDTQANHQTPRTGIFQPQGGILASQAVKGLGGCVVFWGMVMGEVFIMEGVVTMMLRFMMQVAMFDSRRKLLKDELQKESA
jgi:hypothetical protein